MGQQREYMEAQMFLLRKKIPVISKAFVRRDLNNVSNCAQMSKTWDLNTKTFLINFLQDQMVWAAFYFNSAFELVYISWITTQQHNVETSEPH